MIWVADINARLRIDYDDEEEYENEDDNVLSWVTVYGMLQLVELLMKRGVDPRSVKLDSLERERFVKLDDFEACLNVVRSYLV